MARQAPRSPRSRWLLGLAVPAVVSLAGGCDTDAGRADRRVNDDLQQAADAGGASQGDQAHAALDAAARESGASLPEQIRAKAILAAAELRSADELAATAATNAGQVDRVCGEINILIQGVAADNQLIASLGGYQPQPVLDALKQQATAVAGSDDKPDWVKTDANSLSATAATDKAAAALQAQVNQLDQQVKAETDQRNDLLAKADTFAADAGRAQHQKSVDLFVQGAGARKQAADLAVKIDQDDAQLTQAKADLAVLSAHQDALKAAGKGIDARTSAVNDGWSAIGEQITAIKAHSAAQMGDVPDAPAQGKGDNGIVPATINAQAAQLAALLKRNNDVREGVRPKAETAFNDAIGHYKDALGRATELKTQLGDATHLGSPDRPERVDRDAWTTEKQALDPAQYRFLMATAQLDRAQFYARAAAEAKTVADLAAAVKPVLDTAGLTVPVALDDATGAMASAVQTNQKLAADGFKDAVESLSDVSEGSDVPPELKQGALVQAMLAQYDWSLLAAATGDAPGASTHLASAKAARDTAIGDSAPLPPMLPADLVPPAAPSAAPPAGH
jgi:hypothetical protein